MTTTTTPSDVSKILESLGDSDKQVVLEYISSLQSKITELGGDDETPAEAAPAEAAPAEAAPASSDSNSDSYSPPLYDTDAAKEDFDTAGDCKQQAADAKSNGDYDKALELYNQAVQAAPPSALLYANRAIVLEKLGHASAAEQDCNRALALNPDSAKALKVRGKLRFHTLKDWHGALSDLNQAQSLDYDPDIAEILKELTKLRVEEERKEAQERNDKHEQLKKKAQAIKKAQQEAKEEAQQEAAREAAAGMGGMGGMPGMGGMGGMPGMGGMGGMPGMGGMGGMPGGGAPGGGGMPGGMGGMMDILMQDPEMQEAMKNPKVVAAFSEIMSAPGGPMGLMSNPAKLQEMMADPDVGPVLNKMMQKFMGGGGMPGGGMPGGMPGGPSSGDEGIPDMDDLPDLD